MSKKAFNFYQRIKNSFASSDQHQARNIALNIFERKLQRTKVKSAPIIVQVEVTNKCNLNCIICSRHSHALKLGDLSPDVIPGILKFSRKSRSLILFGYGEPLLSRSFFTLLNGVQSSHCSFTTNGMLMTKETIARVMNNSGKPIQSIAFSIDAVNSDTYMAIREKSSYEVVWRNLGELSRFKADNQLEWPEIWINFVAIKKNIAELPGLIEKAASFGVSQVNVFHMIVWDESLMDESLINYPEMTREIFAEALQKANEFDVRLDLPVEIRENNTAETVGMPDCYQPWNSTYIRYDGNVQACCFSDNLVMGNVREKSLEEIWNDKPYRILRKTVNKRPPDDCRKCELRFRYISGPHDHDTYIKLKPKGE